jgi:peptide/nickel transport system ATP-binding protein
MNAAVLDVAGLSVDLRTRSGPLHAVRDVSFAIAHGETLCLVGESGSGKSMTALALLNLLPRGAKRTAQRLVLNGKDVAGLNERKMRDVRGVAAGMIFQEPMTALNPVFPIGDQMTEGLIVHQPGTSTAEARERAVALLERCGIAEARRRLGQFPHELSGGLRQRVMIAMALMTGPSLLIADEPTTALDVTVQAQILGLLRELQREFSLAILFITHDLGLVERFAHRVAVMYAGQIVEAGTVEQIIGAPAHPYTQGLLACAPGRRTAGGNRLGFLPGMPPALTGDLAGCQFRFRCPVALARCDGDIPHQSAGAGHGYLCVQPAGTQTTHWAPAAARANDAAGSTAVLDARDIAVRYTLRGGWFRAAHPLDALKGVSIAIARGQVLGLVGESGSGKSTLARVVLGLEKPLRGTVALAGQPLDSLDRRARARAIQPVFQDPYSSLNPRLTVGTIVRSPLDILNLHTARERDAVVRRMLDVCGLAARMVDAYPSQLSGGQRQRVAIARALVTGPAVVVCDEPTSALDVSIQSQILNLLQDLQAELGLTYLFISHDLAVVRHMAHRVAVLYRGELVEQGTTADIFERPQHSYTQTLIAAAERKISAA